MVVGVYIICFWLLLWETANIYKSMQTQMVTCLFLEGCFISFSSLSLFLNIYVSLTAFCLLSFVLSSNSALFAFCFPICSCLSLICPCLSYACILWHHVLPICLSSHEFMSFFLFNCSLISLCICLSICTEQRHKIYVIIYNNWIRCIFIDCSKCTDVKNPCLCIGINDY